MGLIDENTYEFDNGSQLQWDREAEEIRLVDEFGNSDELRVPGCGDDYKEWTSYFD